MDLFSPEKPDAGAQFKIAMEQKAAGQFDAAVTSLRRAVIINPAYFEAQYELGLMFRDKAKFDRTLQRHSFEAFRKAASLNLDHEDAHNQYVLAGQQMGLLGDLVLEYAELVKKFPENQTLARINKNIITLSMAMMPDKVSIGAAGSGTMRKFLLVGSLGLIFTGLVLLIAPPLLLKAGKIQKENVGRLFGAGAVMGVVGVGGFLVRSQLH